MNAPTDIQILKGPDGKPAFAVIPYRKYLSLSKRRAPTVPNAVVGKVINQNMTPIRAWREHLGLTQAIVAQRLGISQSAYAQQEAKDTVRKSTREKIARALQIDPEQLAI
jgi:DNA-binding XRE family transcriptional regulator